MVTLTLGREIILNKQGEGITLPLKVKKEYEGIKPLDREQLRNWPLDSQPEHRRLREE